MDMRDVAQHNVNTMHRYIILHAEDMGVAREVMKEEEEGRKPKYKENAFAY